MIDVNNYVPNPQDLAMLERIVPHKPVAKAINLVTRLVDWSASGRALGIAVSERFVTLGWLEKSAASVYSSDMEIQYYHVTDAARVAWEKYQPLPFDGTPDRATIAPPTRESKETATLKALVNHEQPRVWVCPECRKSLKTAYKGFPTLVDCACGETLLITLPLLRMSVYLTTSKNNRLKEKDLLLGALKQQAIPLKEYEFRLFMLGKASLYEHELERLRNMRQDIEERIRKHEAEAAQEFIDKAA